MNSLTELALTKLDILSGFDELSVCVAYERDGQRIENLPYDVEELALCRPVWATLPGWQADITGARQPADLPAEARRYVNFISEQVGLPIPLISVGPARDQIIRPDRVA